MREWRQWRHHGGALLHNVAAAQNGALRCRVLVVSAQNTSKSLGCTWFPFFFHLTPSSLLALFSGNHIEQTMQVARESDFGKNNNVFMCRTHLGRFFQPGDVALGYDLARFVNTDDSLEASIRNGYEAPDVVLVRKCFDDVRAKRRAQHRPRNYKLRQLEKELVDADNAHTKRAEASQAQRQEDLEQFMDVRFYGSARAKAV